MVDAKLEWRCWATGKTVIEAKAKGIESLLQGVAVLPPRL